ncbi:MAG: DinB family protein [Terriglobales bacterium]
MKIAELLGAELEHELPRTRATLERVPAEKVEWAPHAKSMPMGKLAAHVAQLGGFGLRVATAPMLDFMTAGMRPLKFESAAQVVKVLEAGTAEVRAALATIGDAAWNEPWKLCAGEQVLFQGTRFAAWRAMYVNHMVHHRAQLGVYLRILGLPVPGVYGPSADEQ